LRWATKDENEADKDLHGTRYRGEKHGMAKLTEYDVKEIRSLNNSQSQRDVADKFGISQSSVWAIIHRKTWTEVQ
jgi:DNA-binding MarR family transcriptional regulator